MNTHQNIQSANLLGPILLIVYLLSGAASISYEVLWSRMLITQFGVSIFGVVVTVAAFMAGLGLGSLWGQRLRQRVSHPLRCFAWLELAVACSAIIIPTLLLSLETQLATFALGSSLGGWYAVQIVIVGLVLMLPAIAMGAGFALILAAAENTRASLGDLYGFNAVGGVLGALLPLWLLPAFGWLNALYAVAVIGALTGGVLLFLSWRFETEAGNVKAPESENKPAWQHLLLYAGIGASALLLEIAWTRLFGMIMLRTEYVLAIILAVFLLGIGLGSILARHLQHAGWFSVLPVVAAAFAILSLWCLPWMAAWSEMHRFDSLTQALWQQGLVMAALTLPVTLVLGAWLPLLSARLNARTGCSHQSGVWLYGVNSLGAALGTLLAGFVLIPAIGSSASIVLGAMLLLILGLCWAQSARAWSAVIVLGIAAAPVLQMPQVSQLLPQVHAGVQELSLHEDAISITHVVEREDGQRQLLADLQRMDAASDPTSVEIQKNQARLPLLLHAEPSSVLFLGLGTGISAAGSLAFPDLERTAVELSRGAIAAANNEFKVVNQSVSDRLRIVRDDARHYLMSSRATYDVIIGDLFHPDLVGRSALLSRQQFQRARNHLNENGVFVQWLALNQFDLQSLQVVLRTFKQVFPQGLMFVDAFRLALVGTEKMQPSSNTMLNNLFRLDDEDQRQATGDEGPWTWLSRYWGEIPESTGRVQDEWAPVIEYRLPDARYNGDLDLREIIHWLMDQRPTLAEANGQLAVEAWDQMLFADAYRATSLAYQRWLAVFNQRSAEANQLLIKAYEANPRDRWLGFALADGLLADRASARQRGVGEQRLLESVLRIRPDHTEALRALWHWHERQGDPAQAVAYRQRLQELSPLDAEIRTVHDD